MNIKTTDRIDYFTDKKPTKFETRIAKIAESCIPTSIDRTDDGEFVITSEYPDIVKNNDGRILTVNGKKLKINLDRDGNVFFKDRDTKKALGYFLNEDCDLCFTKVKGKIQAYYYGDDDNYYHFDVDLNEKMSDEEIKINLIKGFSKKFGWIELFEDDEVTLKEVDVKFWAVFYYEDERKLIEVDRKFFDQHVKSNEECEEEDYFDRDPDEHDEYYKLCEMAAEKASKHFKGLDKDSVFCEFYQLNSEDIKDCAFISIGILE